MWKNGVRYRSQFFSFSPAEGFAVEKKKIEVIEAEA